MTTEEAITVLACALVDRKLLLALQHDPQKLALDASHRAAAAGLDTSRLALFAGFITMVRHNKGSPGFRQRTMNDVTATQARSENC